MSKLTSVKRLEGIIDKYSMILHATNGIYERQSCQTNILFIQ